MTGKEIYERCILLARMSDCEKRKFGCVIGYVRHPDDPLFKFFDITGYGFNHKVCGLENFNCCKERESIASGTRTEYCAAIHAEMDALQRVLRFAPYSIPKSTLYVAGLNGDWTPFDNSKGFYCLPCAKELVSAGISKIALAFSQTQETGVWSVRTINKALSESLEFTKGTKKV